MAGFSEATTAEATVPGRPAVQWPEPILDTGAVGGQTGSKGPRVPGPGPNRGGDRVQSTDWEEEGTRGLMLLLAPGEAGAHLGRDARRSTHGAGQHLSAWLQAEPPGQLRKHTDGHGPSPNHRNSHFRVGGTGCCVSKALKVTSGGFKLPRCSGRALPTAELSFPLGSRDQAPVLQGAVGDGLSPQRSCNG